MLFYSFSKNREGMVQKIIIQDVRQQIAFHYFRNKPLKFGPSIATKTKNVADKRCDTFP